MRRLARTKYSYPKRRVIDRAAKMVRRSDGIKDLALKIKAKAKSLIDEFKTIPTGKKIAAGLATLVALTTGLFAAKSAIELKKGIEQIKACKTNIANGFESVGPDSEQSVKKILLLKNGLKVVLGLVDAIIASVLTKIILSEKNDSMIQPYRLGRLKRRDRRIRHSDGIKDIASKIRAKAKSLAELFKEKKVGKKVALSLLALANIAAGVAAAKTIRELKQNVNNLSAGLENTAQSTNEIRVALSKLKQAAEAKQSEAEKVSAQKEVETTYGASQLLIKELPKMMKDLKDLKQRISDLEEETEAATDYRKQSRDR